MGPRQNALIGRVRLFGESTFFFVDNLTIACRCDLPYQMLGDSKGPQPIGGLILKKEVRNARMKGILKDLYVQKVIKK